MALEHKNGQPGGQGSSSLTSERVLDPDRQAMPAVLPSGVAIRPPVERTCDDAGSAIDPEIVERLCRKWAEVGRAILARRSSRE